MHWVNNHGAWCVERGAWCVREERERHTHSEFAEDDTDHQEAGTTGDEPERIFGQSVEVSEVSCNSSNDCEHGESERSCRRRSKSHSLMLFGTTWHLWF